VHRPALALPLALLSHFVLDALPHYGYGYIPHHERDQQRNFLRKQTADTYFALLLFWVVPYVLRHQQAPIVTMLCMLAGFLPDVIWPYQYVMAQRRGGYKQPDWYARFHKAIQWCERPWGLWVELGWLAASLTAVVVIAN
ncbi:MAG TPA: hypothetical protein VFH39_02395, partial [Candidatus Saccharimonadales bacterium]|nr:hypothetical protein [Candidatus Saccharimonadales bacterium]